MSQVSVTRTVNRGQKAEYVGGSLVKGFLVFRVTGYETVGRARTGYEIDAKVEFNAGDGKAYREAREAVQKKVWDEARAWVRELGELVRTDSEIRSSGTREIAS